MKKTLTLEYIWMYGEDYRSWQLNVTLIVGTILLLPVWIIYGLYKVWISLISDSR